MSTRYGRLLLVLACLPFLPGAPAPGGPPAEEAPKPARADRHGDPLPGGAVARIGTLRLRHCGEVCAIAFAPGGKVLASGGSDGTARLWDPATGRELRCLAGKGAVWAVTFSPDGKVFAAGGRDGTVVLWDPASGKEIDRLGKRHSRSGIRRLAFTPDGRRLAGLRDCAVVLWDMAEGTEVRPPPIGADDVSDFALAPDGKALAVAGRYGIALLDLATGLTLRTFDVPAAATIGKLSADGKEEVTFGPGLASFRGLAFSPDGTALAAADNLGGAWVWDVTTGSDRHHLPPGAGLSALAFAPGGKALALGGGERDHVGLWDLTTGKPHWLSRGEQELGIHALTFAPDGKRLAAAGQDGRVRLWDTATRQEFDPGHPPPGGLRASLSPDGKVLATFGAGRGGGGDALRLWETAAGKPVGSGRADGVRLEAVAFAPDGKTLAATGDGCRGKTVVVIEAATGKELRRWAGAGGDTSWLLFAPDGNTLAAADDRDNSVVLWDPQTGRERLRLRGHAATVKHAAFSPDGNVLVTAAWDGTVRVWDVATGHELRRLDGHGGFDMTALAFASEGGALATAGEDGFVVVWDARAWEKRRRFRSPVRWMSALALSPDGKLLAGPSDGSTFSVCETATGKPRSQTAGHEGGVHFVGFTPDGTRLVTAGYDQTALVWDVKGLKLPEPPAAKPAPADRLGDPLPAGAVARLGSVRWRQEGAMTSAALSPDGKTLATVASSNRMGTEVRAWDTTTGKELWRHDGYWRTEGRCLAFASDGRVLAMKDARSVTLHDARTGEVPRRFLAASRGYGAALALSPDGKVLATGGRADGAILLWDVAEGRELRRLQGHGTPADELAFSAGGRRLLSSSSNRVDLWGSEPRLTPGPVFIWDVVTGQRLGELPPQPDLTFSPDGRLLAHRDGRSIRVEDVDAGKTTCRVPGEGLEWAFSPDGKRLATGGERQPLRVWDTATGQEVRAFPLARGDTGVPAGFTADGKLLVTRDGPRARLWDVARGEEVRPFGGHRGAVTCLAYAPDGRTLVTGGEDRAVLLWEARTGKELAVLPFPGAAVTAVAFAPDGKTAAAGGRDGSVRLYDVAAGKELHRFAGPEGKPDACPAVRSLAFGADGRTLMACDGDGTTALWDVKAKKELRRLKGQDGERVIGLCADGAVVVSVMYWEEEPGSVRGRLRLRHPATDREIGAIQREAGEGCYHAALSPDGKRLAVACAVRPPAHVLASISDPKVRLFEVATGREVLALETGALARALAFSPDGGSLVTLDDDDQPSWGTGRRAHVWDLATGQERGPFPGHPGFVEAVAVSPDGRSLATAGNDGTVLVWDVASLPPARRPRPSRLTAQALDAVWADLADGDAARAYRAVDRLAGVPDRAVALLRDRLPPAAAVAPERIAAPLAALDDGAFGVRERARQDLEKLAEMAEPALRKALEGKPSAEVRCQAEGLLALLESDAASPERLRALRATAVLERVGTPEARRLLEEWARGAPEARLTREAKASLKRLDRKRGDVKPCPPRPREAALFRLPVCAGPG